MPSRRHFRHVLGGGLGGAVVDSIAAPGIRDQRMGGIGAVAQVHLVRLARPAAIAVIGAGGQGVAENAMLHVEHRHVLMNHHFKPPRIKPPEHRGELFPVEVIAPGPSDGLPRGCQRGRR